ncbi:MAG: glycoside hydrolase family 16 protein [Candidatus Saccharibacteria bacterium]|nr:glycoside hydrolase family 16 protein [Candidatus Saccharibacteria bacterium]
MFKKRKYILISLYVLVCLVAGLTAGYAGADYYTSANKKPVPVAKQVKTVTKTPQKDVNQVTTMPAGDLPGWKQIFADDFTVDAAIGAMGSDSNAGKIVYTGANGTKWVTYPKTYLDTYQKRPYRSDKVLSVHDGNLDFYLHSVDGQPAGANPSPVIDGTSQYQTYGRYSARFKLDSDTSMNEYYIAWLLWPENDIDWQCAESDFPEMPLDDNKVKVAAHYGCKGQEDIIYKSIDVKQWHTYTQEWLPGKRNYYLDDVLIGSSTNQVFNKPQRWQLQTETKGYGNNSGHLLVDWAVVYKYSP